MKITYLFPIFKEDDAKAFFTRFIKSKFFLGHPNYEMLIYLEESDEKNLKYLSSFKKKHKSLIFTLPKNYSYNDAFYSSIKYITGDHLLLGDVKIPNVDLVFEKCESEYNLGSDIVLVKLKKTGAKHRGQSLKERISNGFTKLYTGNTDSFNVTSLGFYDRDIIDLFKALPDKACFLKNTKGYYGFKVKTIYISSDTKIYKPRFKMTFALKVAVSSLVLLFISLLVISLVNVLCRKDLTTFNILMILVCIVFVVLPCLTFPKHFFDIRNGFSIPKKIVKGENKK